MRRTVPAGLIRRSELMAVAALCVVLVMGAASCAADPLPATPGSGGGTIPAEPEPEQEEEPVPGTTTPAEWRADGVVSPGEYVNELDNGTHHIFWSSTAETLRVAVQASTTGWVAVGFQPGARMKNADIVFGMVENGQATVLDSFSTGDFGPHNADVKQGGTDDLLVVAGAEIDSTTTIEFERKLDTGDPRDVVLERGTPVQIIWAYGSSDGERVGHSTRGYDQIVP